MSHLVAIFDTDKALEDALNKLSREGLLPEDYSVYLRDQDIAEGTVASVPAGAVMGSTPAFPTNPTTAPSVTLGMAGYGLDFGGWGLSEDEQQSLAQAYRNGARLLVMNAKQDAERIAQALRETEAGRVHLR
ncbi:MAG TPA: hypothetical protein VFS50_11505 [Meiothermus sp.]|jgi:hypothetical protein|nr:hypothetical protein [Meiothermus sp.]